MPDYHEPDVKGLLLLKFQQVPEETAEKLARILDLVETHIPYEPTKKAWRSRIPLVQVHDDGSSAANRAVSELTRLGLPYHVREGCKVFMLQFGRGPKAEFFEFKKKDEPTPKLRDVIHAFATKHGKLIPEKVS